MTGMCFSDRATHLIVSCAERVYKYDDETLNDDVLKSNKLNGKPTREERFEYFSPIEVFIHKKTNQKNGNNKILIDYLKDNRKTLNFK